ncbi:MAG: flavodoxin domain-containing protein [Verrucomicrobia bacterium]|nr:flavodoxin domain-containing protein [Verrucomicrobiota bacterium]MCH8528053.1 flavodoxin domain-containing protein [Kiritimatiellia bacterium]
MSTVPVLPESAPFTSAQREWLNGFLAGLYSRGAVAPGMETAAPAAKAPLMILFGSQTGTAEGLARETADKAASLGFEPTVLELDACEPAQLLEQKHALIITSTYGDGEMPDNARGFWGKISAEDAPKLSHLAYSVLALGDTNYETFCTAGKELDARFEALGARRVTPRVDCDVDYEEPFSQWIEATLPALKPEDAPASPPATGVPAAKPAAWSKKNPYTTTLLENRVLSGEGSEKDVRHYVISLPEADLPYTAGDALSVMPENSLARVEALIGILDLPANAKVTLSGESLGLADALRTRLEIRTPAKTFVEALAAKAQSPTLDQHRADPAQLAAYLDGREVLDLLREYPVPWTPEELVSALRPLQARAYSISSSPKAHPGEVHLCVSTVKYTARDREQTGVCSGWMADLEPGAPLGVFLTPNKHFGVPENDAAPMIMVGPGTGIAPFRAFLEERRARGASGKNWLFFGDRHEAHDFLYADELKAFADAGGLHRLDLAWSRDTDKKVYVQDKMREHAAELYQWLNEGASFFVCGDAHRMAKDVEQALLDIFMTEGKLDEAGAKAALDKLKKEKRYVRDVY